MNPERHNELMRQLAALAHCELDEGAAARIRSAALCAPRSHYQAAAPAPPDWLRKLWSDAIEPAFVLAASATLLTWAVRTAMLLHG